MRRRGHRRSNENDSMSEGVYRLLENVRDNLSDVAHGVQSMLGV